MFINFVNFTSVSKPSHPPSTKGTLHTPTPRQYTLPVDINLGAP